MAGSGGLRLPAVRSGGEGGKHQTVYGPIKITAAARTNTENILPLRVFPMSDIADDSKSERVKMEE